MAFHEHLAYSSHAARQNLFLYFAVIIGHKQIYDADWHIDLLEVSYSS